MKIAFIHLALFGFSSARLAIMDRAPSPPSEPGRLLIDAILNGLGDWGPAGSLKPPTSQNAPLKSMPGAVPSYHKAKDPNQRTGVTRIPGQPLGPAKKCRPCFRKRQLCCAGGFRLVDAWKPTPAPPFRLIKNPRPPLHPSRFKVPKSAGKAAVFSLIEPFAHKALDTIKKMDNPIGYGVAWFDDSMASLQESIGGPQRDDIYGNELKHRLIKGMGSALQLGFETTWQKRERLEKEAAAREEARRQEEAREEQKIMVIEQLAAVCAAYEHEMAEKSPLGKAIQSDCDKVATAVRKVQAREVAKARARRTRAAEPDYWFEECKCNRSRLPELGAVCGDECRVIISLAGP